jgi:uncharacterized SAM-binding protein YcdF (DUF218 family)
MISQIAYTLLFPPNLSLAIGSIGVCLLLMRYFKLASLTMVLAVCWTLAWSMPITSLYAGGWLEKRYSAQAPEKYPVVDAIVVLGGHIQGNRSNWFEPYDKQAVVSRESIAATLYLAGKAPIILLSGGALDGTVSDTASMARNLRQLGIPGEAILQETQSQSTRENAELTDITLQDLEKKQILLVTSALHMPRAMAAFENTSTLAKPAPLPRQIQWRATQENVIFWPHLQTLLASRSIIKEYAGLIMHWLTGLTV